jgi:membrane protein
MAEPRLPPARSTPARVRIARAVAEARYFVRRLYEKASEDQIFFLAGAIAFNVLVAFIPFILAVVGIGGTILRLQGTEAVEPLLQYLTGGLPPGSREWAQNALRTLIDQSAGLLGFGTLVLMWLATRLVATLRAVLREVFDIREERGIIAGKIFDMKMVLAAGTLFALNVGLTILLGVLARYGLQFLGLAGVRIRGAQYIYGWFVTFLSGWVMFLLVYRYLPARRIQWRTALIAATFAAVLFELLKYAFGWYATSVANYRSTYGNLTTLIVLVLWVYYTAVVFILGGEVAQVAAMQRIRRQQKERLR